MRSYQIKRKNNIIIGTLCAVVLLMVVGYAAFSSVLNITGTSGISSNWDIEITNIRGGNPMGGDAYDIIEPTFTPTSATFNTGLKTPNTYRMYEVEVTNKGTLDGLVTIASLSCGDNEAIGCNAFEYDKKIADDNWNDVELTEEPNGIDYFLQGKQDYSDIEFTLTPGEKHYIYVMVGYMDIKSQPDNLSANIKLELTYEQVGHETITIDEPSKVLKVYPFRSIDTSKVLNISFLNTKEVSSNATKSWDASAAKDKSVMAWIVPSTNNSDMYDLYVGADGGVIANQNSSMLFEFFDNLQTINFGNNFDTSNVVNMDSMFSNCSSLTSLDLSNFDTSNVTKMASILEETLSDRKSYIGVGMFNGCTKLESLNLSNFDINKVTSLHGMFSDCSSLTNLDLGNFDTSNVTDMGQMFSGCSNLASLNLSNFNTRNVTDMGNMFSDCSSLTSLDLSRFDTKNVTGMNLMFAGCSNLASLNLSNFDTGNVTVMSGMFQNCESLTSLDLSNFDTKNVTNMDFMFCYSKKMKTIYVGQNWTTANAKTKSMFYGCGTSSVTRK